MQMKTVWKEGKLRANRKVSSISCRWKIIEGNNRNILVGKINVNFLLKGTDYQISDRIRIYPL